MLQIVELACANDRIPVGKLRSRTILMGCNHPR